MSQQDKKLRAESLVRLTENPDGARLLRELGEDFDKAMRTLLYTDEDKAEVQRGYARAYQDILSKFTDAHKELKGNTHGAS